MEKNDDTTVAKSPSKVRPVYITMATPANDGADLVELWNALFGAKWLILGVTVVFAVAAIAYSLHLTPVYRAEAVLAPATQNATSLGGSGLSGLASLAGINLNMSSGTARSMAVLRSRNFIAEFIRDENLLVVLFSEEWDAENQRWKNPDQQRDIRDAVKLFEENVRFVSEDPETGLVTLAVEWKDAQIVAEWVRKLVVRINQTIRQKDIEESERKLAYLYEQLGKADLVELRQAISSVIEEQINAMMLAQAQIEYAFTVVDPPVVPKQRIRPKRTVIVIVATFLGGLFGIFVVIARLAIRRQVLKNRALRRSEQ